MGEGMAELLTNIGSFFTQSVGWLGEILSTITGNPALLILVIAMPVIGLKIAKVNKNGVNSVKLSVNETIPSQA